MMMDPGSNAGNQDSEGLLSSLIPVTIIIEYSLTKGI